LPYYHTTVFYHFGEAKYIGFLLRIKVKYLCKMLYIPSAKEKIPPILADERNLTEKFFGCLIIEKLSL
jgi:hypothetical protein